MLKKINVKQLVVGMHIKEFCGSWMDHPFWRNAFVLASQSDLDKVLASNIHECWIDSDLGLDVLPVAESTPKPTHQTQAEIKQSPETLQKAPPAPTKNERAHAEKICAQATRAVASMFQEARMGKAVDAKNAQNMADEISASVARNPSALISLARLKTADDYTYMHSVAVSALMISLGRQLHLDNEIIRRLGVAGILHDLGKAKTPMNILNKPGKLTDEEFMIMRKHPEEGRDMLRESNIDDEIIIDVVLHHHEKIDSSGYPEKLKRDEISIYTKIAAICDVYDAITSNRAYKEGWDPAESLKKMADWVGSHFEQETFQGFVKSLGIYPIGSLVKLSSGNLGVVVDQSEKSLLTPRIKTFFSTRNDTRILPEIIDLARPHCTDKIISREDPAKWKFKDLNEIWMNYTGDQQDH